MSLNRSAWMTPDGRPAGQLASKKSISALSSAASGASMWWREPSYSGRQPATDSALGRLSSKSRPARCRAASASPTCPQWAQRHATRPQPLQEGRDGGGPSRQRAQRLAVAAMDRPRAIDAARGEMVHQAEEERQVRRVDALFVERDEVGALGGGQQVVGVLDAFGDALEGFGLADVVLGEKGFQLGVADFGVDRHQATSARGSLNTTLSSVVRTSSTVTS